MKIQLYILLILVFNIKLYAQEKSSILNSDKKGLENVEIYLPDYDLILYTDNNGIFELPNKNNLYLIISKEGYKTVSTNLNEGSTTSIVLEKLHVELDEIVVSTINHKLSSNQTLSITSKKIKQINNNSSNFVQALNNISGIDNVSTGTGISKVVVRGLSGARVVTYINGVRIENQQWGADHGIGFTSLGFSSVEVMKGPSSIMFGADALRWCFIFCGRAVSKKSRNSQNRILYILFTNLTIDTLTIRLSTKWSSNDNFRINAYAEYGRASDYQLPSVG
jgi:iron complex outermembrane receptor protein